jgi:hypothetical protein
MLNKWLERVQLTGHAIDTSIGEISARLDNPNMYSQISTSSICQKNAGTSQDRAGHGILNYNMLKLLVVFKLRWIRDRLSIRGVCLKS